MCAEPTGGLGWSLQPRARTTCHDNGARIQPPRVARPGHPAVRSRPLRRGPQSDPVALTDYGIDILHQGIGDAGKFDELEGKQDTLLRDFAKHLGE